MNVLTVYNGYRHRVHGEEAMVKNTIRLLQSRGNQTALYTRNTERLQDSFWKQLAAGLAGIHNPATYRRVLRLLRSSKFDVVHAHNIYPWVSPAALLAARRAGVPVVLSVHHHWLTCPVTTHFHRGRVCAECSNGREFRCIQNNCRDNLVQSVAYALRSSVARRSRHVIDNVAVFVVLNNFCKSLLTANGCPAERIAVRPNMIRVSPPHPCTNPGTYVGYVGRVTREKGVDVLCEAAGISGLPLKVAGDVSTWPSLPTVHRDRVEFVGVLQGRALEAFYLNARFIVVPSVSWEMCPMVVLEAMNHDRPVIVSDAGGLPEMVEHGITGLVVRRGEQRELAVQMGLLWDDHTLRDRLAAEARRRLEPCFGEDAYFADLMTIYNRACSLHQ